MHNEVFEPVSFAGSTRLSKLDSVMKIAGLIALKEVRLKQIDELKDERVCIRRSIAAGKGIVVAE